MRKNNSIKNTIWACSAFMINLVISFFARKIFLKYLGLEYNGLNGLFNSILSMLSIAELGVGNAILFSLYKPVSENSHKKINSLMHFYKKSYNLIALIVLITGLIIMPFLGFFVGDISVKINIYLAYFLFLLDSVCSYLLVYKRTILVANQNERIIKKIHIIYILTYNLFQMLFLYFTKNYYIYLIVKILATIIENLVISRTANKYYPYLLEKPQELDKETKDGIMKKIKALFFHKIGGFVVTGTDNMLISYYFGIVTVGLYNNYYLILGSLVSLVNTVFTTLTASVGNLLVEENRKLNYEIYKKIDFMNFYCSIYSSLLFCFCVQSFIRLWLGSEFLLPFYLIIVMTCYYFFRAIKFPITTFKDAAGIYHEDRFVPILESIFNIVFSIILAKFIGLAGIFIGTIISNMVLHLYSYPKYVYVKIFDKSFYNYYSNFIIKVMHFAVLMIICYFIYKYVSISNNYLCILFNFIICSVIMILDIIIFYGKSKELNYFKDMIWRKK